MVLLFNKSNHLFLKRIARLFVCTSKIQSNRLTEMGVIFAVLNAKLFVLLSDSFYRQHLMAKIV